MTIYEASDVGMKILPVLLASHEETRHPIQFSIMRRFSGRMDYSRSEANRSRSASIPYSCLQTERYLAFPSLIQKHSHTPLFIRISIPLRAVGYRVSI